LPVNVISGIFTIVFVKNTGIAFGFLAGNNAIMAIITLFVIAAIIKFRKSMKDPVEQLAGSIILGGAISNLIDRVLMGAVVDYIKIKGIPTFNIADAALTVGAALIITAYLKEKFK